MGTEFINLIICTSAAGFAFGGILLNLKGVIALSRPIFWPLLPLEVLHFANFNILVEPYTSMKPSLTATLLRMALQ